MNMYKFQFYKKDEVLLHLNVDSPSYLEESEQLIAQGFELKCAIVEAENSQLAHEKFKIKELENFTKAEVLIRVLSAGAGGE